MGARGIHLQGMNMTISEYKETLQKPLRPRAICFLVRGDEILLGRKKEGFGKGNWVGVGGKIEEGETIEQGIIRELKEEIGVDATNLKKIAVLNFYFPHVKDEGWNQRVHAFIADSWSGEPVESDEIYPQWFRRDAIPFGDMWDDARYWLQEAIAGKEISADFVIDDQLKVVDKEINDGLWNIR